MKRLWHLCAACFMLLVVMSACGDSTATSVPAATPAAPATTAAATTAAGAATTAASAATTAPATTAPAAAGPTPTFAPVVSGNGSVTINWWHIQTTEPGKSTWTDIANAYVKLHPNVKIVQNVIENENFKAKLATVMQSGNPPDLFQSWGGGVLFEYAKAGLVKDLTGDLQGAWGDSINKSALDVYGTGGKYYGVPFDMGAVGFFYNKTLFQKAGISAPPATWSDFLQDIAKLKAANITPIAFGDKEKWPGLFYYVYFAVREGGQDAFQKAYTRTGSFADPAFVAAGQKMQDLLKADPFPKGFLGLDANAQNALVGQGQAAMELMGQWAPGAEAALSTDKKGLGDNEGFFAFPALPDGKGGPTDVQGGGNGYAVGKNALPEAIDFLKYFTSVDNQRTLATKGIAVPVVKGAEDALPPLLKQVQQTVANAKYFQLYYDQYLPPDVAQTTLDASQGLFAGSMTPQQAAQSIEDVAAQSLQK